MGMRALRVGSIDVRAGMGVWPGMGAGIGVRAGTGVRGNVLWGMSMGVGPGTRAAYADPEPVNIQGGPRIPEFRETQKTRFLLDRSQAVPPVLAAQVGVPGPTPRHLIPGPERVRG